MKDPFDDDPFGDAGGNASSSTPTPTAMPIDDQAARRALIDDGVLKHSFGDDDELEVRTVLTGNRRYWQARVRVFLGGEEQFDDLGRYPSERRFDRDDAPAADDVTAEHESDQQHERVLGLVLSNHTEACAAARAQLLNDGDDPAPGLGRSLLAALLVVLLSGAGGGVACWLGYLPMGPCVVSDPPTPPGPDFVDQDAVDQDAIAADAIDPATPADISRCVLLDNC